MTEEELTAFKAALQRRADELGITLEEMVDRLALELLASNGSYGQVEEKMTDEEIAREAAQKLHASGVNFGAGDYYTPADYENERQRSVDAIANIILDAIKRAKSEMLQSIARRYYGENAKKFLESGDAYAHDLVMESIETLCRSIDKARKQ